MKALLVVMLLASCSTGRADEPPPAQSTMTVASYNIRFDGIGEERWAWTERRERILETIRSLDADIVGLQEVTSWDGMEAVASRQIPDLAQGLPGYTLAGAQPSDRIWSSNPVLLRSSRFTVVDSGVLFFSRRPLRYPEGWWGDMSARFARWVRVADSHRDGATLLVVNAHYSPVRLLHRWRSSGILIRHLPRIRHEGEALIMLGDLNAQAGRPSVRRLLRRLELEDALAGATGASYGGRRIDHILHSRDLGSSSGRVLRTPSGERMPSDHDPVRALLGQP